MLTYVEDLIAVDDVVEVLEIHFRALDEQERQYLTRLRALIERNGEEVTPGELKALLNEMP